MKAATCPVIGFHKAAKRVLQHRPEAHHKGSIQVFRPWTQGCDGKPLLDVILFQGHCCLLARGTQVWEVHQFIGKAPGQVAPESQRRREGQVRISKAQKQQPGVSVGMITSIEFLLKMSRWFGVMLSGVRPFQQQPVGTDNHT